MSRDLHRVLSNIDDFDTKGSGLPANIPLTGWAALMKGQTLGKRVVIKVQDAGEGFIPSPINILQIQSHDQFASQLNVTLSPPKFLNNSPELIALQNPLDATGEASNIHLNNSMNLPRGIARINWGIGGTFNEAEIDFLNGLCINLNASFLNITAAIDVPGEFISDGAYVFAAFVGPGYAKAINAQRTIGMSFANAPPEFSQVFPLPAYAKTVTLVGIQAPVAIEPGLGNPFSGTIQFFRNRSPGFISMLSESFFDQSIHHPVDIPNGAYYFRVKNLTPIAPAALAQTSVQAIFDLGI